MSDKLVTIATFPNAVLAAMARNRLEQEGIRSFINDGGHASGLFGGILEWVKLDVSEEDADRALDILDAIEENQPEDGAFTETPPGPAPEDMEPEIPEEKPNPYTQPVEISHGFTSRDFATGAVFLLIILIGLLWILMRSTR